MSLFGHDLTMGPGILRVVKLLVANCVLRVACCELLVARCELLVARCEVRVMES